MLPDGIYVTVPIHGSENRTRAVKIVDGTIRLNKWCFSQEDFFKVNRLVPKEPDEAGQSRITQSKSEH